VINGFLLLGSGFADPTADNAMVAPQGKLGTGNPHRRGRTSTVDLLVLTRSDRLLLTLIFFHFYKTSYFHEEVNSTEHIPSVRVPWLGNLVGGIFFRKTVEFPPAILDPMKK